MRREGGSGAKAKARLERRVVLLVVLGTKVWPSCGGWLAFTVGIKWAVRWEAYGGRHVVSFK